MASRRETVGSLRAYFLFGGTLIMILNVPVFLEPAPAVARVVRLVSIVFGVSYVWIGIVLPGLLIRAPQRVVQLVLVAAVIWAVMAVVVGVILRDAGWIIPTLAVSLGTLYLLRNLRRLAREARDASSHT